MAPFQKILVAVDRSPVSEQVFARALALAETSHATLIILSAIELDYGNIYVNPSIYAGGESITINHAAMKIYLEKQEQERDQGLAFLQDLARQANAVGVATEISQQLGDPGRSICDFAKTQAVDLIVVGRRGHKGLNELWMGSVSNYIMHHAPCSVLIIQGQI
jgi:nucleotide-binding universal stress UspA family protein